MSLVASIVASERAGESRTGLRKAIYPCDGGPNGSTGPAISIALR
jgi:hypothetical protein